MVMIRMKTNSTTAVPIKASLCRSVAYPISITILAVRVLTPLVSDSGMIGWLPATITTAIVSPIARPIPRTMPANIPFLAEGIVTWKRLRS